ncbi:DUF1317 family protein [Yersinia enterocolitica]
MTHSHDNITVGCITLVYSEVHHGWITPYNQVVKNQIVAQLIAERINSNLKLSLAATDWQPNPPPHYRQSIC